ncbi:MAG TPA: type VI secretion system membrane subunit TssM [Marinagarivorans sp.]
MKSFFKFITNKWVIGIIGLIAFSLFIWLVGNYVKFGEDNASLSSTHRIIIIVVAWIIWLTWMISRALFERSQNKKLFNSIEEQADEDGPSATDEKSIMEAEELSGRFQDALQKLQVSRSSIFGNSRSLYQLPWYIIIGPPGSGKTTALINSGLEFPLAEATGEHKLRGVGGTRNCDWWFTNDAILIDTAGRYTTQDSHKVVDQSSWTTFLDLLKKFRSRRPINGILLTVSLQDLLLSTPEQRQLQAKTLRTRIDEIQNHLGIRAPVYMMLTKADLIAGFSEFFAGLSKTERNQVWGMTLSLTAEQPASMFRHEFSLLIKRLNQRVLGLVNNERIVARKSRIQNFPQRMAELSDPLHEFIYQTFSANRFGTTPLLRGVYFSSGTQEGMPIDRMMAHMNSAFNVKTAERPQENTGKSFFVYTLFKEVIFPESELVGSNMRVERLIRWGRRGAIAAIITAIIGSITVWTTAIGQNKSLLNTVNAAVQEHDKAEPFADQGIEQLLAALNPLRKASNVYNESEQSYLTGLGLYSVGVDEAADKLYQSKLNSLFLPSFAKQLTRELRTLTADDPRLLSTLKTYLMLFNPEHQDNEQILGFAQDYAISNMAATDEQLLQWLDHLKQLLAQPLSSNLRMDELTVASARQKALQISPALRLYEAIKTSPQFSQPVDLYRQIGGDTYLLFGISNQSPLFKMPAAFMKPGFEKIDLSIDSPLAENYFNQQWIWGTEQQSLSENEKLNVTEQLERLYLTDYATQWQNLMSGLTLNEAKNLNQLSDQLYELSNPASSPLKAVIELTSDNTKFTKIIDGVEDENVKVGMSGAKPKVNIKQAARAAKSKVAGAWNDQQERNLVEKQFTEIHALTVKSDRAPAPLDDYLAVIGELNEYLLGISASPDPDEAAFNAVQKRFMGQTDDPIRKLQLKAKHAPRPLNQWLNNLSRNSWQLLVGYSKRHLNRAWQYQVVPECQKTIDNRFPFTPTSSLDAHAMAFNDFFGSSGSLQMFFDQYLTDLIDQRRWSAKSVDGITFPISSSTLRQLERVASIRRAFFSAGDVASAQLQVTPSKLSSNVRLFTLEIGGTPLSYSHGPRTPKSIGWTLGQTTRARILFEDLDEAIHQRQYDGDWAWYRLIADMKSSPSGRIGARKVTFTQNGNSATYQFVSNSGEDPLDMTLFTRFKCPESL